MPGNAKPGKIKSPGNAAPGGQIKIEDIQDKNQTVTESETTERAYKPVKPAEPIKPVKTIKPVEKAVKATDEKAKKPVEKPKPVKESVTKKGAPKAKAVKAAKVEKTKKTDKAKAEKTDIKKAKQLAADKKADNKADKKSVKAAIKADKSEKIAKAPKTEKPKKDQKPVKTATVKVKEKKQPEKAAKAVEKTKAKVSAATKKTSEKPVRKASEKSADKTTAKTAIAKPNTNTKTAGTDKVLPKPSLKEQKPSDKPLKTAVKQKTNPAVKKSNDKPGQISLFDPTTFDQTVRDMEITYISLLSYVGKLYIGHFAKSGYGGGIDAVLSDVTEYIAHGLKVIGKKNNNALAERLCKTVFRSTGEGWKGGVPLALKITVAMDLHGGSKYTETLCSDIQRIYELAKIAGVTRLQAKEMIGGLKTFAAGQGIDIK